MIVLGDMSRLLENEKERLSCTANLHTLYPVQEINVSVVTSREFKTYVSIDVQKIPFFANPNYPLEFYRLVKHHCESWLQNNQLPIMISTELMLPNRNMQKVHSAIARITVPKSFKDFLRIPKVSGISVFSTEFNIVGEGRITDLRLMEAGEKMRTTSGLWFFAIFKFEMIMKSIVKHDRGKEIPIKELEGSKLTALFSWADPPLAIRMEEVL